MASVVSICNQAISRLGGDLIISLDDDSKEASLCKANYASIRDVVLEESPWSFAIKRYLLPKSAVVNAASQFANRYLVPSGVLNVIRAGSEPDDRKNNPDPWRVEGDYIETDANTCYAKTVISIEDPNKFTPNFRQALALRLAAEIAIALTSSINVQRSLMQEYGKVLETASIKDGQQGTTNPVRSNEYILARYSSNGYLGPTV